MTIISLRHEARRLLDSPDLNRPIGHLPLHQLLDTIDHTRKRPTFDLDNRRLATARADRKRPLRPLRSRHQPNSSRPIRNRTPSLNHPPRQRGMQPPKRMQMLPTSRNNHIPIKPNKLRHQLRNPPKTETQNSKPKTQNPKPDSVIVAYPTKPARAP